MAAVFTLVGDAGKGWLVVAVAQHFAPMLGFGESVIASVALGVFLGHLFPVFLGFQGGKGVATALGVLLGFSPWMGLLAAVIWVTVAVVWRISSLSALAAAVLAPVYAVFFLGFDARTASVVLMSLLLIWRHKANIAGLIAGTETRIGKRGG